ncbi:MAG: endoglucanase [Lachnospiraceae bacterium]|nr:endoglucanase [Lachnospiraceae bacterium]
MKITKKLSYTYRNAPIPGGGYVTGLLYHQQTPDILYARTDIGGVYRFEPGQKRWKSLIDHVTMEDLDETYPAAIALDDHYPERLYIASGVESKGVGKLSVSEDYGETFRYEKIPVMVHGNISGRGTGQRLVVDPQDSDTLYFASSKGGLLRTRDRGKSWEKLPVPEDYMTFIWVSEDGRTLVAGTAGYTSRVDDTLRGHSLYVSYDEGKSFVPLEEPESPIIEDSKMNGLVAQRYAYDGKYLYVTMCATGRWNYIVDLGYSCDTGDTIGGKVVRYSFSEGRISGYTDITPDAAGLRTSGYLDYGFGGISTCKSRPGLVACATLCKEKLDTECIYVSEDYGETWRVSLKGLEVGDIYFNSSYMRPQYNGNRSLLHWESDVKINPFNANELWFNSGTGVFTTDALLSDHPRYHDHCDGIEETVHLNVYGPVSGEVQLVDIVGDLGGFAFRDLTKPCRNSFDDAEGNRYITCINADLSDADSSLAIITARGNWRGLTKGGLVRTQDGFQTFQRIPMPWGQGEKIDAAMREIERPNVNPGWVAMSPDGQNIVWSIADRIWLPMDMVISSRDGGRSFAPVKVYEADGSPIEVRQAERRQRGQFSGTCMKVFSDRVNPQFFYGFGESGQIYISRDGGASYVRKLPDVVQTAEGQLMEKTPICDFGMIDTANPSEIRGAAGESGVFYIAMAQEGMWKLVYEAEKDCLTCTRLSAEGDSCLRLGLGLGRPGGDYVSEPKAIYLCGCIDGEYGFYRTLDEGRTYERLNTEKQMYGEINSIDGDKRVFGRFFLATGSRGVIYGEPCGADAEWRF